MILALDPSLSCIGWAVLTLDGERVVEYGAYRPRGNTLDEKLMNARWWLRIVLGRMEEDVTHFAFEMPVVYRNAATTIKLAQLAGVLRVAAFEWAEQTIEVNPGGRLAALGLPVNMKRAVAKFAVIANVNALFGLELKDSEDDIGDAIAVGVAAAKRLKLDAMVAK